MKAKINKPGCFLPNLCQYPTKAPGTKSLRYYMNFLRGLYPFVGNFQAEQLLIYSLKGP